jgi:excinuclease ABC subunit C
MKTIQDLKKLSSELPTNPGVYKYFDINGDIIYVGKAKNLRSRVKSYFYVTLDKDSKTYALVKKINHIEHIEVRSELEALILEAALIKKYTPKYNIRLIDDKSYIYILIKDSYISYKGKRRKVPSIHSVRETDLDLKKDTYYGPFPDASSVKYVLKMLRKVFSYRDCSSSKFNTYKKRARPCLYGQIDLCLGPCADFDLVKEYQKNILKIKKILAGDSDALLNNLERKMKKASKNMNYEEAAKYRDQLQKFDYIRKSRITAQEYIDNPYLLDDLISESLQGLQDRIPELNVLPQRIECYDISNIQGTDAVGSMVVAVKGRLNKSFYRRFKIKQKSTPDDFGMLKEVLTRRLNRGIKNHKNWDLPDLLVIDGGKGQVSTITQIVDKLNLDIPVIGLAKKFETIIYRQNGELKELLLPKDDESLKLLQRLRDESHRFAQAYHHKLRSKFLTN